MLAADQRRWTIPPRGQKFRPLFESAAAAYGVPARLLARVAQQESSFRPDAHNAGSDASGLMQLVPRWYPGVDPFDPAQAIPAAAESLARYYGRFGSWRLALAAYNWGPGNLSDAIASDTPVSEWPTETQNYIAEIGADVLA